MRKYALALAGAVMIPLAMLGSPTHASAIKNGDPVIAAAGDIACAPGARAKADGCHQAGTASLLTAPQIDTVLTLGDNQYNSGTLAEFTGSYDATWGRQKAITAPAPGNHDYNTAGAQGYFDYFGAAAHEATNGYYSYDVGTWHLIALNTGSKEAVPTDTGSQQELWLKNDLATHTNQCVLAYWHHPRFTAGSYYPGVTGPTAAFWDDLYAANADVVLNGHDHDYQRFAPQTPTGAATPTGIREFVVGTGGKSHSDVTQMPNLEVANGTDFGVLKLTLRPGSYDWRFVQEDGTVFDSGSAPCV